MEDKLKQALPLLKRISGYLHTTSPTAVNAVYISPTQQLRNAADEMEWRDRDIEELRELVKFLTTKE